jgi:hypothetical protein
VTPPHYPPAATGPARLPGHMENGERCEHGASRYWCDRCVTPAAGTVSAVVADFAAIWGRMPRSRQTEQGWRDLVMCCRSELQRLTAPATRREQ